MCAKHCQVEGLAVAVHLLNDNAGVSRDLGTKEKRERRGEGRGGGCEHMG